MKKQQIGQNKMGFSLIELSIVIIVIGILVIGITKGSAIIDKARISSARSLTSSSPASAISDMVAWYETSLKTSFQEADAYDSNAVSDWFDNSPLKENDAAQSTGDSQPTYRENIINSLPIVRFDGSDDTMTFDSLRLNQKYYTVFVVEQRTAAAGSFLDLGGGADLGYSATTTLGDSNVGSSTVATFSSSNLIPRIVTFISDSSSKRVFVNGTVGATTGTAGLTSASASGVIGYESDNGYYTGDIAEIIIYNRDLTATERNDIQDYLSKKYDIKVTTSS